MGTHLKSIVIPTEYSTHGIEVIEEPKATLAPGLEIVDEGLEEVQFGEFLVEKHAISRTHLFRALCEQDRYPGVRIGEVIAALGYIPYQQIDRLLSEYHSLQVVEIGA
jgi:hypothetical protein